jgi:hypothetical protein
MASSRDETEEDVALKLLQPALYVLVYGRIISQKSGLLLPDRAESLKNLHRPNRFRVSAAWVPTGNRGLKVFMGLDPFALNGAL